MTVLRKLRSSCRHKKICIYQPTAADLTLFVDGSCFHDATGYHAAYSQVQLENDGVIFTENQAAKVAQPSSAQFAEIKSLTTACKLA